MHNQISGAKWQKVQSRRLFEVNLSSLERKGRQKGKHESTVINNLKEIVSRERGEDR